jgi:uncharacterized protein (DUF433 family)
MKTVTDTTSELISSDPEILSGAPILAGTRFPVHDVISHLRHCNGDVDRFIGDFPYITREQIDAAQRYYIEHPGDIERLLRERREYAERALAAQRSR